MNPSIIALFIGLFLGTSFGVLLGGILSVSSDRDTRA